MEYPILVFLHVLFGIVWAGGAITAGLFVIPSIVEAGPAGGAVMAGVVKRRFPILMTVAAVLVVLTGLRMYMVRFTAEWVTSPEGMVLTLGGLLGLAAFALGVFVQKPMAERLARLGGQVAASGAPPTPAQAAELQALRMRLARVARVTAWHVIAAASLMAMHRLAQLI